MGYVDWLVEVWRRPKKLGLEAKDFVLALENVYDKWYKKKWRKRFAKFVTLSQEKTGGAGMSRKEMRDLVHKCADPSQLPIQIMNFLASRGVNRVPRNTFLYHSPPPMIEPGENTFLVRDLIKKNADEFSKENGLNAVSWWIIRSYL